MTKPPKSKPLLSESDAPVRRIGGMAMGVTFADVVKRIAGVILGR